MPLAIGFDSESVLIEHFGKHGRELNCATKEEYLRRAIGFLSADVGIIRALEHQRQDTDFVRFCPNSDEFATVTVTGIIRTYFKPMPRCDAPPGYPPRMTHGYRTNLEYYKSTM